MKLLLKRYKPTNDATLGKLYIDEQFFCYTLEDEYRKDKVMHETRILAGIYQIKLQLAGTMTQKYAKRFPDMHRGMLWLQDVPNFTTIYIHIGNTDDDTSGCILVGKQVDEINMKLIQSTLAYVPLYAKVISKLDSGEEVTIEILDS